MRRTDRRTTRETFRRVQRSVVVVRTVKETAALLPQQGIGSVAGVASGVLISQDGKVLTAAHIVQTADQVPWNSPMASGCQRASSLQ